MTSYQVEQIVAQLQGSLDGLSPAVSLVPKVWHHRSPHGLSGFEDGTWSIAMNLAHLTLYEETLAAPVVESLAVGGDGTSALDPAVLGRVAEETERLASAPLSRIIERLRTVRERQIAAARCFTDEGFSRPATPVWRVLAENPEVPVRSAGWVLAKTVQHTWEHGNTVFRIALRVAP
jgi:hypothetical protein